MAMKSLTPTLQTAGAASQPIQCYGRNGRVQRIPDLSQRNPLAMADDLSVFPIGSNGCFGLERSDLRFAHGRHMHQFEFGFGP
jgi:hypothetical protein